MNKAILGLWAGLIMALLVPGAAIAQRDEDWYRDVRPYLDRNTEDGARRVRLWERFVRLRADVRTADRRGDISAREADHYYDRLDKVARFLRDDRHLTQHEYDRRRRDLDNVERDLRRSFDRRDRRDWRR